MGRGGEDSRWKGPPTNQGHPRQTRSKPFLGQGSELLVCGMQAGPTLTTAGRKPASTLLSGPACKPQPAQLEAPILGSIRLPLSKTFTRCQQAHPRSQSGRRAAKPGEVGDDHASIHRAEKSSCSSVALPKPGA